MAENMWVFVPKHGDVYHRYKFVSLSSLMSILRVQMVYNYTE
jgi:hypothetical protein